MRGDLSVREPVHMWEQRKRDATSAGIGPASGSLDGDEPCAGSRRLKQRDEYSQNSRSAFAELLDGEKDQQKMAESSSSEQPRVTQSAAESGGATPQDHTGSRHVSFEIGPLDKMIEKFVGGDHAPSIVPTGPAVKGTTRGEAQECVQEDVLEREQAFSYTLPEVPQRDASKLAAAVEASYSEPSRVTQAADGSGGATSQGQEQDFLNAALNEREEAHQAFRQWLAAKDLETTHWILGHLGIHTVNQLVHLTEKQFEDTLELFPPKRCLLYTSPSPRDS